MMRMKNSILNIKKVTNLISRLSQRKRNSWWIIIKYYHVVSGQALKARGYQVIHLDTISADLEAKLSNLLTKIGDQT